MSRSKQPTGAMERRADADHDGAVQWSWFLPRVLLMGLSEGPIVGLVFGPRFWEAFTDAGLWLIVTAAAAVSAIVASCLTMSAARWLEVRHDWLTPIALVVGTVAGIVAGYLVQPVAQPV